MEKRADFEGFSFKAANRFGVGQSRSKCMPENKMEKNKSSKAISYPASCNATKHLPKIQFFNYAYEKTKWQDLDLEKICSYEFFIFSLSCSTLILLFIMLMGRPNGRIMIWRKLVGIQNLLGKFYLKLVLAQFVFKIIMEFCVKLIIFHCR